ncbi:phasin family protein [Bosea lathyri]|uniref:phasin family protein n=1 Tax=Bosea lathyri TaxID=1036778 RepID=UPI0011AFEADD|nr:phasin family protein [Bosea lathyri]
MAAKAQTPAKASESVVKAAVAAKAPVEAAAKAVVKSVEAVKTAAKAAPSLTSMPLPRPPEFVSVTSATVMTQAVAMAKAFGALQAKMLDHACAELKATLTDAESLARTDSPADAVALQAKAVRRSYESYADHLKELARIASGALRKER